jgi:hypothetical protein
MYRHLNADRTLSTIETLNSRIAERFPDSGLSRVCSELYVVANESKARALRIARPNYGLRLFVGMVVTLGLLGLFYSISLLEISTRPFTIGELVQLTEAGMNDVVLIGAAILFLITVEVRIKRVRVLEALHELRSIAHVIDMHQLTKDPGRYAKDRILTVHSPSWEMTAYELTRYLDYCSEMLSLTGKVGALYAQNLKDAVVLSAVNELENLTTGLSRKVWQKIMILHKLDERTAATETDLTYK